MLSLAGEPWQRHRCHGTTKQSLSTVSIAAQGRPPRFYRGIPAFDAAALFRCAAPLFSRHSPPSRFYGQKRDTPWSGGKIATT